MKGLHKYIPLVLFSLYAGKHLVLGNLSLIDAVVMAVLGGVSVVYEKNSQDKKIKELEGKIEEHSKEFLEMARHINEAKTQIASVKLGSSFRTTSFPSNTATKI